MTESNQFPLIEIKLTTSSEVNRIKLEASLVGLARNDSQLVFTTESESNETLIGGISEIHLDNIIKSLQSHGLVFKIGAPQVAYLGTITNKLRKDYTHKKMIKGKYEYARLIFELQPNDRGAGNIFVNNIPDGSGLNKFQSAVKKGLHSVLSSGPIVGFPLVDMKVTWLDGAFHHDDSSDASFEVATRASLREGIDQASPILLEPVMKVEVTTPDDHLGPVISGLHARRGKVIVTTPMDRLVRIDALVSLANMFGYSLSLSSQSHGAATFTMKLNHYEMVAPPSDPDNFSPAIGKRA